MRAVFAGTFFVGCALATPWFEPPAPAAPLVEIHGLAPRQLKSTAFDLPAAQQIEIEACGAESDAESAASVLKSVWTGEKRQLPWMGNAWILDLKTRAVVWELSAARTSHGRRDTRTFDGSIRLPAGAYEAFYAAYPSASFTSKDEIEKPGLLERLWNRSTLETIEDFKLVIRGEGRTMTAADLARANDDYTRAAIVDLSAKGAESLQQIGFSLDRPTAVDVSAIGEAREDGEFDFGWIINADTREKVWRMSWADSSAAGGAEKNRAVHVTKTLPAGRYAALYATDDSHDPSEWNAPPPHDPVNWGLLIRVPDATARAAVKTFPYDHVPGNATLLAMTGLGDSETQSRGLTLSRPMDVRVYAVGEGRDGHMFDYGWIVGPAHRRVWEMRYDDTESAGGAPKNRLVDRVVHLDKGDYTVYYVTDGSHSAGHWNSSAPADGRHWGITLLAANGPADRAAATTHAERPDPSVIAQIVRVRDDERPNKRFSLAVETPLRVYAIGEGVGRQMADYGWIENAQTGRTVWEMTYRATDHAGGAQKNRRFDGTITLPRGEYILRYETDGSHSFGDWNADPPDDPASWGITLYRIGS